MDTGYEFWGLFLAVIGTIIAIVKIWFKWSVKMADHKEFVIKQLAIMNEQTSNNTKDIGEAFDDIDKIKTDGSKQRKDIYDKIGEVNKMREQDIKSLAEAVERSIEKSRGVEERHHGEIMGKIEGLTIKVIEVCSTFEEYRKSRNGG